MTGKLEIVLDLFKPLVPRSEMHPHFQWLLEREGDAQRAVLLGWAEGFVDRDGKFVREFQTTFNSSFWELYLHALLRSGGAVFDTSLPMPDFVFDGPLGALAVEAVTTRHPEGGMPETAAVHLLREPPPATADMIDLACQRLAQAIQAKASKYRGHYAKQERLRARPFLIAVAPFEQPFFFLQGYLAMQRVLYGYAEALVLRSSNAVHFVGESRTAVTRKTTGAVVPLGLFASDAMRDVSAVLFSTAATMSKVRALNPKRDALTVFHVSRRTREGMTTYAVPGPAHHETLGDGLHLFLNPHADSRFDIRPWAELGAWVHLLDPATGACQDWVPEAFMMMRMAMTAVRRAEGAPMAEVRPPAPSPSPPAKAYRRMVPPDGEWLGISASSMMFAESDLVLYRGFTVLVARDRVDDDWMAMAKKGTHLSMQEFLDAGDPDILPGRSWSARAEARAEIERIIDVLLQA